MFALFHHLRCFIKFSKCNNILQKLVKEKFNIFNEIAFGHIEDDNDHTQIPEASSLNGNSFYHNEISISDITIDKEYFDSLFYIE